MLLLIRPSTSSLPSVVVTDVTFAFNISTYKINGNGKFQMNKFEMFIWHQSKEDQIKTKIKPKHLHTFCSST
jgi:hypothetical protein